MVTRIDRIGQKLAKFAKPPRSMWIYRGFLLIWRAKTRQIRETAPIRANLEGIFANRGQILPLCGSGQVIFCVRDTRPAPTNPHKEIKGKINHSFSFLSLAQPPPPSLLLLLLPFFFFFFGLSLSCLTDFSLASLSLLSWSLSSPNIFLSSHTQPPDSQSPLLDLLSLAPLLS